MFRSPEDTRPEYRNLRIYAIDPMVSRAGEHQVTAQIRFEPLELYPADQPVSIRGRRLEVIDVDTSRSEAAWLKPVNLQDANIAMQHGLEPSESDPQFHQQMVYAVAMRTLEQFDRALGRVVYFKGGRRLRLVPHAFRGSNAFYHPRLRAVLFGYFTASAESPGENLPGQNIFTCISHDIIAHEIAHAVVDRLRPHFNVASNPHVRAFHEGFADIVAIFQRLTFRELVQPALQDAKGAIQDSPLLSNIAAQFGQGLGSGKALRTALGEKDKTTIQEVSEEHALGAILVAAIFEGFYTTYMRRTADLVRIATGGTGVLPQGALHPDLVGRLATECIRTAQSVLTMCIRAFDYLPPADVTFGAFLRALVTADWELNPLDEVGLRASMIEACRRRGIFAADAGSLAVSALLLQIPSNPDWDAHQEEFRRWVDLAIAMSISEQRAETRDDEFDLGGSGVSEERSPMQQAPVVRSEVESSDDDTDPARTLREAIQAWFARLSPEQCQSLLKLRAGVSLATPHFHTSQRLASDGVLRFHLVVQMVQLDTARRLPGGTTLVIDVTGHVRFVVSGGSGVGMKNEDEPYGGQTTEMGWRIDGSAPDPFAVDYRGMHEARI